MAQALRDHRDTAGPNITVMKGLASRGHVIDNGSRIGCRMWNCYPLTPEGERVAQLLGTPPPHLVLDDALWLPTCGHREIDVRLVAWSTYDDDLKTVSCIHCALKPPAVPF